MAYIANSVVNIEGKEYRPGDAIQAPANSKAMQILLGIGYVVQVGPGEVKSDECLTVSTDGHLDRSELEAMSKANLQKLAADLDIDSAASLSKAKLVEAIAAVSVNLPTQESE